MRFGSPATFIIGAFGKCTQNRNSSVTSGTFQNSGHYPSSCLIRKHNSTLQVCPYLRGNTLRLRYEPNRLTLPIGLWRWYINITITILDIIYCPVFCLKLNSTLQGCPYFRGNTLRLRYKPNRLMLSACLWRWYINITITILDIIHGPDFYLKLNSTL
jgi:hypothetical protein